MESEKPAQQSTPRVFLQRDFYGHNFEHAEIASSLNAGWHFPKGV
jgi:hypothetical protein